MAAPFRTKAPPKPKAKGKLPPPKPKPTYTKPPRQTIPPPKPKQTSPPLSKKISGPPPKVDAGGAFAARYAAALKKTPSPTPGVKATTPTMTSTGVTRVSVPRGTSNPTPGAITSGPITAVQRRSTSSASQPDSDYSQIPFQPVDHSGSFGDMFNEQMTGAYGAIDDAEAGYQASAKGINQMLMSPGLAQVLGPKVYASMVADVLKKQASDAGYYAQQRADLAAKIPTLYNTLQSQLADQDAKDAQLAHDYWNDSLKHGETEQQFGLDTQKFGLDQDKFAWGQKTDTAKISLDAKKAQQSWLLGKGKLALQGTKLGLDTYKVKTGNRIATAKLTQGNAKLGIAKYTAQVNANYKAASVADRSAKNQLASKKLAAQIAKDANKGKLDWAKLTATTKKAATDAYYKDQSNKAAWARIGISSKSQQTRAAALDIKAKNGGFTVSQMTRFKSDAYDTAQAAYQGIPSTTYKDGTVRQAGVPKQSYQDAMKFMLGHNIPPTVAANALNGFYKKGERGRPLLSAAERAAITARNKKIAATRHPKRNWQH